MTKNIARLPQGCAALWFLAAIATCVAPSPAAASPLQVQLPSGRAIGQPNSDGVYAFLGIPYARAPEGRLRFMPPLPPPRSSRTVNDLTPNAACAQPTDPQWAHLYPPVREDCLRASIWTPRLETSARLPVVVWIHGGGFMGGSAVSPRYDGGAFSRRGGVVFVGINYRLGPLGFLDLSGHGGDPASGNLGILDQVRALEWVRDNIARFGGDPSNVTVMGESAGGTSIVALLTLPSAKGLFHKAIIMSGPTQYVRSPPFAAKVTEEFMRRAGASTAAQLQSMSIDKIYRAQLDLMHAVHEDLELFGPVVDGKVVRDYPLRAIQRGDFTKVPVLHGTTQDETRLWQQFTTEFNDHTAEDLLLNVRPALRNAIGADRVRSLVATYASDLPAQSLHDLTFTVTNDQWFRIPHVRLGEALAAQGVPNWLYIFTWATTMTTPSGLPLKSAHSIELPFVLHNLRKGDAAQFVTDKPPEALADLAQDTWIAFVKNGDPNNAGLPPWSPYDARTRATMRIDTEPRIMNDPGSVLRKAWDGVPFDGVVPRSEWNPK